MKKTLKQLKADRKEKRHYGMAKLKKSQKFSWISKQDKNGWSLGLVLNSHTRWLRNVRFASEDDVVRATNGLTNIVVVELKK
jgi:hypothetical protein